METNKQEGGLPVILSGLALLLSVICLLAVCHYCYPNVEQKAREVLGGMENSPARQAFHTMAEGLEAGEPVKQTLTETVQVLFGKTD